MFDLQSARKKVVAPDCSNSFKSRSWDFDIQSLEEEAQGPGGDLAENQLCPPLVKSQCKDAPQQWPVTSPSAVYLNFA